jgi:Protein-only RNase P/Pentacotripeptide-repeat region of PRORP
MDQDTTDNSCGGNNTQPDESIVDNIAAKAAAAPVKESSLKRPWSTTNPTRAVVVEKNGGDAMASTTNQKKKKSNGTTTTSHPPKKRKHMDPIILQLRTDIHQCCHRNDLPTAWQLYNTARRNAVLIEAPVLSNLLSLCDGLGDRPLHIGTPRLSIAAGAAEQATNEPNGEEEEEEKMAHAEKPEEAVAESAATEDVLREPTNDSDDNEPSKDNTTKASIAPPAVSDVVRCDYAQQIRHYMQHDRHLALTETAYTALTRLYARAGDLVAAEQCLSQAEQTQQCKVKLRLYSPVLLAYSARHNWMAALALWARICRHQLSLTEREYASLLPAPYMERVLADLIEDVSVPSKQTVQILRQCLSLLLCSNDDDDDKNGHVDNDQKQQPWRVPIMTDEMKDQLAQIPAPELQTTLTLPIAEHGWTESTNCTIDRSNGVLLSGCLQGVALQAVTLADEYVQTMLSMNERIVLTGRIETDATPFQGGGKGKKRTLNERDLQQRQSHWQRFRDYMATAKAKAATAVAVANQPMISVVIDGANVGYHEQNYKGCPKHVNYEQIDAVVRQFDPATILLVLHTRHCSRPLMPAFARRYLEKWQGFLYQTPHGMNDDWFWLHAALETNAMVVTNDHMRDHHFQMVTPRSFLRWRDRHQIYFHLAGGGGGRRNNTTSVQLTYPDPYSRRIQLVNGGLIVPMPKKGDESRFLDGCFVADDAPEEEMYVCFRPQEAGRSITSIFGTTRIQPIL